MYTHAHMPYIIKHIRSGGERSRRQRENAKYFWGTKREHATSAPAEMFFHGKGFPSIVVVVRDLLL